jgi:hypothetical protein
MRGCQSRRPCSMRSRMLDPSGRERPRRPSRMRAMAARRSSTAAAGGGTSTAMGFP